MDENQKMGQIYQVLVDTNELFSKIKPVFRVDLYLGSIIETCSRLFNAAIQKIDLVHTDNIVEKFRFQTELNPEPVLNEEELVENDFESLLKVYFELCYMMHNCIGSVELENFDQAFR